MFSFVGCDVEAVAFFHRQTFRVISEVIALGVEQRIVVTAAQLESDFASDRLRSLALDVIVLPSPVGVLLAVAVVAVAVVVVVVEVVVGRVLGVLLLLNVSPGERSTVTFGDLLLCFGILICKLKGKLRTVITI